jgi:hypothetical protein
VLRVVVVEHPFVEARQISRIEHCKERDDRIVLGL